MFKAAYLITFLSVLLLNSEKSFSETLKRELGVCGNLVSAIFTVGPEAGPSVGSTIESENEFCDYGRYEVNANYLLSFFDANKKLIYDKQIYLNPFTFYEEVANEQKGEFTKTRITKEKNTRIVKFPQVNSKQKIVYYRVRDLDQNKTYEIKKIED